MPVNTLLTLPLTVGVWVQSPLLTEFHIMLANKGQTGSLKF